MARFFENFYNRIDAEYQMTERELHCVKGSMNFGPFNSQKKVKNYTSSPDFLLHFLLQIRNPDVISNWSICLSWCFTCSEMYKSVKGVIRYGFIRNVIITLIKNSNLSGSWSWQKTLQKKIGDFFLKTYWTWKKLTLLTMQFYTMARMKWSLQ